MRKISKIKSVTNRDDKPVSLYLQDIASYPLLTPDEEVNLALLVKEGDKDALDKLVLGNLRFVVTVAKQYQHLGLNLSDLISAGNIGLIEAAMRFDPTRGFRFVSYAVWYINKSIQEELTNFGRMVRLPNNQMLLLSRVTVATAMLEQKLNRRPTVQELAEELAVEVSRLENVLNMGRGVDSLNETISEDDSQERLDQMADTSVAPTDAQLMRESLIATLNEALQLLEEKDRDIMKLLFNLDGGQEFSLGEVAQRFGLTSERVRQIRTKCLDRIRRSVYASSLAAFL